MNVDGKGGFKDHPENANTKGRPKGAYSIMDVIKRRMADTGESGRAIAEEVAEVVIDAAIKSKDLTQCRDLMDRLDGKALQKIEVSNEADLEWLKAFKNIGKSESKADGDTEPDATESTQDTDT